MTTEYLNFLEHHGIKGQKWGRRRYQNEDGSLTQEGRERYGIDEREIKRYQLEQNQLRNTQEAIRKEKQSGNPISTRRSQLQKMYEQRGLSSEQAEVEARNRERLEKVVKAAAGVALAAALAYGAYRGAKYISRYGDKVIRKGTEVSRVTAEANPNRKLPMYVAFEKGDKAIYRGEFAENRRSNEFKRKMAELSKGEPVPDPDKINVYNHITKANKKMKIAGERTGKKVYESLLKNDEEFRKLEEKGNSTLEAYTYKLKNKYDKFNVRLAFNDDDSRKMANKFYDALKKKGYSGVIDVNDRWNSGYRAKKPTILFNYDTKVGNFNPIVMPFDRDKSVKRMSAQLNVQRKRAQQEKRGKEYLKALKKVGFTSGSLSAVLGASIFGRDRIVRNDANRQRQLIEQYKKDHPNTRMSDREILDSLLR